MQVRVCSYCALMRCVAEVCGTGEGSKVLKLRQQIVCVRALMRCVWYLVLGPDTLRKELALCGACIKKAFCCSVAPWAIDSRTHLGVMCA